jgi:hypothetical protein
MAQVRHQQLRILATSSSQLPPLVVEVHLRELALAGKRQIFFATADAKFAGLFMQKFRFWARISRK